ncbi:hypothetical protein [Streptomyces sp. NPDC088762]|uniref:hypothetical protein n=1 Tax=Streptomyces sp. NPDC088762 TaxID=3365891 RepID=UPI003810687B
MRTARALRTSIVTAALAGAMLIPAAGAAFAAPAATPQTAVASDSSRYEGEPVYIGEGLVAVLRNKSEGPEAWIRYVGTDWKPGDPYIVKLMALLNRSQTSAAVSGLQLKLSGVDTDIPFLTVTAKDGTAKSFKLPKAEVTAICVSGPKRVTLGAGLRAELWMTVDGPKADLYSSGEGGVWEKLDRTHPSSGPGNTVRIVNPSGAEPLLEWQLEGATGPGRSSFPDLQPACVRNYQLVESKTTTPPPAPKPSPSASTGSGTSSAPKAQTAGQTTVVPKGAVAAGAEIAAEDTDNATTVAAGAGLMAIFGALGASVVLRRRRVQG